MDKLSIPFYHKHIDAYTKFRFGGKLPFKFVDYHHFFFELVYRTVLESVRKRSADGVGDLSCFSLNLVQDDNVPLVAFAGQKILEFRGDSYGEMRPSIINRKEFMDTLSEGLRKNGLDEIFVEEHIKQAIQEGAALKLMEFYLDVRPEEIPHMLFRNGVSIKGETDWKELRCALYRYFMYSGFIQVSDDLKIIKDSIPRVGLLSKLVDRFVKLYRIEEGVHNNMDKVFTEGKSLEFILNPEKIAMNFLEFNDVKV